MSARAAIAVASTAVVAAIGVGALLIPPADASLTPPGNCEVGASVARGRVEIDAARSDGPFTVPVDSRISWLASVNAPPPTEPRAFNGALSVDAPGGFDQLLEGLLEFRSWSNPRSTTVASGGSEAYDLPSWTPRGVDIPITGFQRDPLGSCRGEILVRIEGDRFASPLAWVAVGGTIFWLAATLLAGKLRDEPHQLFCVGAVLPAFVFGWLLAMARSSSGRTAVVVGVVVAAAAVIASLALSRQSWARDFWGGHPVLGWIGGLLVGLFVSLDLFLFGVVRLDSTALIVPPLLGILGGLAIAWWTPFHGREYA
jgi:hypothetical protein